MSTKRRGPAPNRLIANSPSGKLLQDRAKTPPDPINLERLPVTYQEISDYYARLPQTPLFQLRKETLQRIARVTERPVICYVTRTTGPTREMPTQLDDSDLVGFRDLVQAVRADEVDVLIVSNGGSGEATERIAKLLRERFKSVRFIVPANAYSAATLLCFSGDAILMGAIGTLGPIDPQINGIPARAILRGIENIEKRLKEEGPSALTAYVPLLEKYDLHTLEMCRSAQALSAELAVNFLSEYMLRCAKDDPAVVKLVDYFSDHDTHKSHARSIDRRTAHNLGLNVVPTENIEGLDPLVYSLYNQYVFFFDKSPFYKLFECAMGVNWGRQAVIAQLKLPGVARPGSKPVSPGPQEQSD